MDLALTDRVILVVGGTGYIGSAVVQTLRDEGANVVAASRHGGDLIIDGADDASVDAGIARVLAEHGRLDGLVVTAAPSALTLDPDRLADPAQVIEATNAKAMTFLRLANAAVPTMQASGFGRIVGISGQIALMTGNITGSMRNTALNVVAKNLADATAGTGITVNPVNPGPVKDDPAGAVPVGEPGESSPTQIADLIAFLLSPRTATISGESIAIGHRVRGRNDV